MRLIKSGSSVSSVFGAMRTSRPVLVSKGRVCLSEFRTIFLDRSSEVQVKSVLRRTVNNEQPGPPRSEWAWYMAQSRILFGNIEDIPRKDEKCDARGDYKRNANIQIHCFWLETGSHDYKRSKPLEISPIQLGRWGASDIVLLHVCLPDYWSMLTGPDKPRA